MEMKSGFRLVAAAMAASVVVGSGITSAPPVQAVAIAPSQVTTSAAAGSAPVDIPKHKNGRLVFAHYHPYFATSLDNSPASSDYYQNQLLNPNGEGGKWASIGGYLRDRPIAVAPKQGDWVLANAQKEVADAKAAGIDGFAVDLSCSPPNPAGPGCFLVWANQQALFTAAAQAGFKIMLQPDMDSEFGAMSQDQFASSMAAFAKNPAVYKRSGKVVLSPFRTENRSASWWKGTLAMMKAKGVKTFFMPQFLQLSAIRTSKTKAAWDKISSGYTDWGSRTPNKVSSPASALHKAKKIWMHPVAVQDARPKAGLFWEAGNSATLRATWSNAIKSKADLVMLLTWNDYSESTSFAPSSDHGWAFLDINQYYLRQFQAGRTSIDTSIPATQDEVIISHRIQKASTPVSYSATMKLRSGSTAARDTIEVVTLLTSAATVTVSIGANSYTYQAPAGHFAKTYALTEGTFTASVQRAGSTVATVTTKDAVSFATTAQQDLSYHAVTSLSR